VLELGGVLSFDDVELEVAPGERIIDGLTLEVPLDGITVLVGRSGSGKSTLLRLCNRLEVPTRGTVAYGGRSAGDLDVLALRRQVGMVFQHPVRFAGTVRDNLLVAVPSAGDDELRRVLARSAVDGDLLDREAADLSGGEAQRMCLARTLLTEPQMLLMDEVTSSLDPDARRSIEELTLSLVDDGMAVLWVTHDLDQAHRLSSRVVVIESGRVAVPDEAQRFLAGASDDIDPVTGEAAS